MTYLFYSIRASPAQMRCEPSCTAYLFPHFCHRFAPPKTTSLPKKFFSFAVKRCIMLLECAAFCFLWEIFVICQQSLPLQFIPARGRKRSITGAAVMAVALQFIPARGQKSTSATGVCQQRRCFAFSYILFYRLGAMPAGIVFVTGSALTPCGTSGFMGRISCR